jgi:hypothetical protein
MASPLSVSVRPRRILAALIAVIAGLVGLSILAHTAWFVFGHNRLLGFVPAFDIDGEGNVPAHFSALLLLGAAGLLGIIAHRVRRSAGAYGRHWVGLSLVFAYLSVDEFNSLHERLVLPLRTLLDTDGIFYFAWVLPGMVAVALFAVAYFRFFLHLPGRWRGLFATAGCLYVGGALGVELLGGWYVSSYGPSFTYAMITTVEETMEMVGAAVFLYALLDYLEAHVGTLHVTFGTEGRAGPDEGGKELAAAEGRRNGQAHPTTLEAGRSGRVG